MNSTRKIFIVVGILIAIFFIVLFADKYSLSKKSIDINYATTTISALNGMVIAQIADTADKQTLGLSNRTNLLSGSGMLFVFDTSAPQYIWMKDMKFPIDIVWIDGNKHVTHVEANVSPITYLTNPPKIFYSPTPALYVLELPVNDASRLKITVGASLKF